MIVRALPNTSGRTWPAEGEMLTVLEIHVGPGREPNYRVEREETPVLVPASEVEVAVGEIPPGWAVDFNPETGALLVGPQSWQAPGFWERFFDFDPRARREYHEHRRS